MSAQTQALENGIVAARPDLIESGELLAALHTALKQRYGDEITDALGLIDEAEKACYEADNTVGGSLAIDDMDAAREARLR